MQGHPITIVLLDEAKDFVANLPSKAQKKVVYNLNRVQGGEMDAELFQKLAGTDIWEFRTLFNGLAYRLFAFWDKSREALVVATHGLSKKTQKTPPAEIAKAERKRREYLQKYQ